MLFVSTRNAVLILAHSAAIEFTVSSSRAG